jgi:hypothetical protein
MNGGITRASRRAATVQYPQNEADPGRLRYERQLSEQDDLSVMMYAGERETTQYQSIPRAPQLNRAMPAA